MQRAYVAKLKNAANGDQADAVNSATNAVSCAAWDAAALYGTDTDHNHVPEQQARALMRFPIGTCRELFTVMFDHLLSNATEMLAAYDEERLVKLRQAMHQAAELTLLELQPLAQRMTQEAQVEAETKQREAREAKEASTAEKKRKQDDKCEIDAAAKRKKQAASVELRECFTRKIITCSFRGGWVVFEKAQ